MNVNNILPQRRAFGLLEAGFALRRSVFISRRIRVGFVVDGLWDRLCPRALHMSPVILAAPLNDSFSTRGTGTGPIIGHLSTEVQGHVLSTHIRVTCIDMYCDCIHIVTVHTSVSISITVHRPVQIPFNYTQEYY